MCELFRICLKINKRKDSAKNKRIIKNTTNKNDKLAEISIFQMKTIFFKKAS